MRYFIFFLFFIFNIYSQPLALFPAYEGDHLGIIEDCVDIITGCYVEKEVDHVVTGPDLLYIQRSYTNRDYAEGKEEGNWCFFPHCTLLAGEISGEKYAFTADPEGGFFPLSFVDGVPNGKIQVKDCKGITNISKEPSGQTNRRNIFINEIEEGYQVITGNGTKRLYQKKEQPGIFQNFFGGSFYNSCKDKMTLPIYYQLVSEYLPSGNIINYAYDGNGDLSSVELTDREKKVIMSWVHLIYNEDKITVTTSDKEKITYIFSDDLLTKVVSSLSPEISYEYTKGSIRCLQKKSSNAGDREIIYDEQFRVKSLKKPFGKEGVFQPFVNFSYNKEATEVLIPTSAKMIYRYNSFNQLTSIEKYDKAGALYRVDKNIYGKGNFKTEVVGKKIENGLKEAYCYQTFAYDAQKNVIKEDLYANLIGKDSSPLPFDEDGNFKGEESSCLAKNFVYSSDGLNLLLEEKDVKGFSVAYNYKSGSNLLISKVLLDNKREDMKRIDFKYDQFGDLIFKKEWKDEYDIALLTEITPRLEVPSWGEGEVLQEFVVDKKKKTLQKKVKNYYDEKGNCIQKDIFDTTDTFRYALKFLYDERGNLVQKNDALGRITYYSYNEKNNLIASEFSGIKEEYDYDCENRRILEKHYYPDNTSTTMIREFDLLGNLLFSTDRFGNKTFFSYDEWGRLISTTFPEVYNEESKVCAPKFQYSYDFFDNVVCIENPKGYKTSYTYTLHGNPSNILYPDGTSERFSYDKEGSLHRKTSRNEIVFNYEYDELGRTTEIEKFSQGPKGPDEFLGNQKTEYSTFSCSSTNFYNYDNDEELNLSGKYKDGKLISRKLGENNEKMFLYDEWGTLCGEKWFNKNIKTLKSYDLLGRVFEEKQELDNGEVYFKKSYAYDSFDNLIKEITYDKDNKEEAYDIEYDFFNFPKKIQDPLGNIITIDSNYFYQNDLSQKVLKRTIIDPTGIETVLIYDALNRIIERTKKDKNKAPLFVEKIFYDLENHPSYVICEDLQNNKKVETRWFYGPMDHLEKLVENAGLSKEKQTVFIYNKKNQLIEIQKPTLKTPIKYFYSSDGYISKITFPDFDEKEAYYEYSFDSFGRIEKASSKYVTVSRYYKDQFLEKETIQDEGMSYGVSYQYDDQNRLKKTTLPDGSAVKYSYGSVFLKSITRKNNDHNYLIHDNYGRVLKEKLIGGITRNNSYDSLGRKTDSITKSYAEKADYDALGNITSIDQKGVLGNFEKKYQYDSLSQMVFERGFFINSYTYDNLFNRLQKNDQKYIYDENLCTEGDSSLTYDPDGNISIKKSSGKETAFSYDSFGHLRKVKDEKNEIYYRYDPLGRRYRKHISANDQEKTSYYFYVNDKETGSLDEHGKIIDLCVLDQEDEPIEIELSGDRYAPLLDLQGNVVALFSVSGSEFCEMYAHSVFGDEIIFDNSKEKISSSALHNPWRYKGGRTEEETGLIFFENRFYDPQIGRWLTPDPMGFIDGPNLYAFVKNNPLRFSDEWGLSCQDRYYQGKNFDEYFYHDARHNSLLRQGEAYKRVKSYEEEDLPPYSFIEGFSNRDHFREEKSVQGMIGFINGICNSRYDVNKHADYLSKMGWKGSIDIVYNATHGIFADGAETLFCFSHKVKDRPVQLLQKQWREFFEKDKKNSFLQFCHSQGSMHVYNALKGMSKAERKRIIVVAIAPVKYIPRSLSPGGSNYRSKRDIIPLIDIYGFIKSKSGEVHALEPHKDAPLLDHDLESPTYKESIQIEINKYLKGVSQ